MLSLTSFTQHVAHKFTPIDRIAVKIALISFGLLIANIFPVVTTYHRGYYLAIMIVCESYLIRTTWSQKK